MGSIRGPAGNCGIFGLKPGGGVVPQDIGFDSWGGMSQNGPLATTVTDAALLLSVMAGRPELANVAEPQRPLRIVNILEARGFSNRAVGRKVMGPPDECPPFAEGLKAIEVMRARGSRRGSGEGELGWWVGCTVG